MARAAIQLVVRVEKKGNRLNCIEVHSNEPIAEKVPYGARRFASDNGTFLAKVITKAGNTLWRRIDQVPIDYSNPFIGVAESSGDKPNDNEYRPLTNDEVRVGVMNAYSKKPNTLILPELQWKLAARAMLRGENILFIGASGSGKTLSAATLAKVYGRPFFRFNMGALQDARTSLIGNTHYNPEKGTFFAQSDFITAITTPGAAILLDEVTRLSNDAENILLTALDKDQRYLRIDENPDNPVVHIAPGVCFFGTANIGTEYTSTRTIDRATKDRFTTIVDIPLLTEQQEYDLLKLLYSDVNKELLKGVAKVAAFTRDDIVSDEPKLSTIISTRSTVEQVALLIDGFHFSEVMEAIVLPMYDIEGGVESERAYMRQFCQGESHLDRVDIFPKLGDNTRDVRDVKATESSDAEIEDIFDPEFDAFVN